MSSTYEHLLPMNLEKDLENTNDVFSANTSQKDA